MNKQLYQLIAAAIISFSSTGMHAEAYRWVDDQGNIHFGDKIHASDQAEDISAQIKLHNIDHSAERSLQSLQQIELRQQAQSIESQQRKTQQQNKNQPIVDACRDAKQRLRVLQGRVIFIDKDQNEVYISERQRQQRVNALQEDIKRYCR